MKAVLTLVASRDAASYAQRGADVLHRHGARVGEPVWLAGERACDLPFDGLDPAAAEDDVRRDLGGESLDLAAQGVEGRRKRLLVADMESTMIANEMIDDLAEVVGCGAAVADVTARAMNGELDFETALRQRVALLEGLPVAVLEECYERIEVHPGAATLVATMRAHGARTALASGGFGYFAERVGRRLGFDVCESNELEIAAGRLTGRLVEPIRGRSAKRETLERLCHELGVEAGAAAAVGDGANDLSMLEAAGLGVAYHAKPLVARSARYRVEHGGLETLLYFQGYRETDFAST